MEHAAAHDLMAYFSHLIARTARGRVISSWPLAAAWRRALEGHGARQPGGACGCQEPDGFMTPALQLLKSMRPENSVVADWRSFMDTEDPRLRRIMEHLDKGPFGDGIDRTQSIYPSYPS